MEVKKIKFSDKCPMCDGHGHIEVFCTDHKQDRQTEMCPECQGAGILSGLAVVN